MKDALSRIYIFKKYLFRMEWLVLPKILQMLL